MTKSKSILLGFVGVLGMTLGSCALASHAPVLTADVGYVKLSQLPAGTNKINPIRLKAIQETATQLGARGALAWRALQINRSLKAEATHLNHVFNFNKLLINNDVLPPVITQSNNDLTLDNNDTIRLASKIYKIVSPARFVTAAPTWRTYLWMEYQKPSMPNRSLLPTTQAEAAVWNMYLKQGWEQGLAQANDIFQVNLDRLKRDYDGIVLYRQLLAQHMVSSPFVAQADLGITGNAKEIRINDKVLRITSNSQLQTNSSKWQPVITN